MRRVVFEVAAYTDIGPRKKTNQDSCCALVAKTPAYDSALLAVCDGVGGLASGELASGSMVAWLVDWFEDRLPKLVKRYDEWTGPLAQNHLILEWAQEEWSDGLRQMNDALRSYGASHGEQLGTTCTVLFLFQGNYLIAHVGDSRVYRFRDGGMDILTEDQTWVAQQVALGNIPPEQARHHPKRNVILQAVGTQPDLQPVFNIGMYAQGDAFMLCCDGFRNELFDDELIGAFSSLQSADESQIEAACKSLTNLVLIRGESDNITAVALSVQPGNEYAQTTVDEKGTTRLVANETAKAGE